MFTHAASPSAPTVSPSALPASPTGPSRSSRLLGLSYLLGHTHNHLSSNLQPNSSSQRNSITRTTSSPGNVSVSEDRQSSPTSGWVPVISGHSGLSRLASEPQQTSAEPATGESTRISNLGGLSRIMARHRAGTAPQTRRGHSQPAPSQGGEVRSFSRSNQQASQDASSNRRSTPGGLAGYPLDQMPTIKFIPYQDARSSRPSLAFAQTSRTLPHEDCVIRVGRYSERDGNPNPPQNIPSSAPVGFKSKVVSRRHCEFWCSQGQWYIKDIASSSGTFLNHIRLSQPSIESRPFPVNDGDVVQLGIDFKGGEEMIYRCVKIRVECNRGWQKSLNNFNVATHKQLRALNKQPTKKDSDTASAHSSECSICLMSIAPCQSLFVAPCSHVWHYKCIRPILNDHKSWPQFLCPNCRAVTDLEADVDDPDGFENWNDNEDNESPQAVRAADCHDETASTQNDDAALSTYEPEMSGQPASTSSKNVSYTDSNLEAPQSSMSRPMIPTAPSLLSRRMASRSTNRSGDSETAATETMSVAGQSTSFRNTSHTSTPTPTTSELRDDNRSAEHSSALLRPTTPLTNERLVTDGPTTPRNDIGPFVFDGSAGRPGGSIVSTVSESSETRSVDG